MTNKKLGIALVGLGEYATGQLAPALQQTEHCYLSAIVTGSPAKSGGHQLLHLLYQFPGAEGFGVAVNEQLKEMDKTKDEFLYTVTHELRTPVTSIRAMAEIVLRATITNTVDALGFANADHLS